MHIAIRQFQVLDIVKDTIGLTASEYAKVLQRKYPGMNSSVCTATPHKRLPELEHMGYISKYRMRECSVTGKLVTTWITTISGIIAMYDNRHVLDGVNS